jgi:hypothetical protein
MEESGKVETMSLADLQGSLEAQEQRLLERITDKPSDQAMQAQVTKKGSSQNKNGNKGKGKGKDGKYNSGKSSQNHQEDQDQTESSSKKGGSKGGGKRKFDRKKLRCFNCNKIGHFSSECKAPSSGDFRGKSHDEAYLVKDGSVTDEDMVWEKTISEASQNFWLCMS